MLICNKCHKENLDIAKFCKECGSNNLYDPKAKEKLEQERKRQEELKRLEEERKRKIEEERKIAQEKREKKLKQRKEFIIKHKSKFIASVVFLFLIASASMYQYFYGGKYSRIYINSLEKKCYNYDESSCKILQNIYQEKCNEGNNEACFNIFISKHSIIIRSNNKWGFIDKNGKTIIKPEFDDIWDFKEGLAGFKLNTGFKLNNKWGFIDKNGKIAIEPKFDDIWDFKEGLARVKLNGKWGVIDKNGKIIIEPKYDILLLKRYYLNLPFF
ncbi:WG repeat-containing protein [Campylobacter sp. TTU-622]|uniref:WG repeat-containing protein n=1 Tax=Campylobacter sp. TTU-622 TaxID=2800583 RepID=UPI001904F550|nr:WG repeat-containing protein [Campylobacter sp. TTU-622]MBK1973378.1 WG repeat-containing protein [Campylobacter sp. TTU-622]